MSYMTGTQCDNDVKVKAGISSRTIKLVSEGGEIQLNVEKITIPGRENFVVENNTIEIPVAPSIAIITTASVDSSTKIV